MKNVTNTQKNTNNSDTSVSTSLEFSDVSVYNEMADQTAVRLNLIQQIHEQLGQLETMIARRDFVMREISTHIID